MAKKLLKKYILEPGISKDTNLFPKAYALLASNKNYVLAEMVAFIDYQIANDLSPYGSSYIYESSKCTRDIGYAIDAVLHDLRYGGNVEIRQIARYFWIEGVNQLRPEHIEGEVTAINFAVNLITGRIFSNQPPTTAYQSVINQVFISGQNAEAGAATRVVADMGILTTVITGGLEVLPSKVSGVSRIRVLEKLDENELLLITDPNTGSILYSFADTANSVSLTLKTGRISGAGTPLPDLDFPSWWMTTDGITNIDLSEDTSHLTQSSKIQIFIERDEQTIRPWDFGTDAIERMRVATPQAMLDADFEYGLQPTKWQTIALQRSYPSLYEIPGTDATVLSITTDASSNSGGFGSSLITVTTVGNHGYDIGAPITIRGLDTGVNGFSRAEGSFLVHSVPSPTVFTYYASSKVGTDNGDDLTSSFVQLREAGFYTGASIGQPDFSVFSNGTSAVVTTKFDTPEGSISIAFDGAAPSSGAPISGSPYILPGTQISGVVGSGTVEANVAETTITSQTYVDLLDPTGIQQGMALDNGSGEALFITSIASNRIQLDGPIGVAYQGANGVILDVGGTNEAGIGAGATFNVDRTSINYTVTGAEDSTSNGQDYQIGDLIRISGTDVGGASPVNDIDIVITEVDSGGAITNFSYTGEGISGGATYTNISQSSTTGIGSGTTITVVRAGGSGVYSIDLTNGGSDHVPGDEITWSGTQFDGTSPDNDIVIRVDGVAFGTQAVVDYTVISATTGVTGDESFVSIAASNISPTGVGATFDVTRNNGEYSIEINDAGSGYTGFSRIILSGASLGGSTPLNNARLVVGTVDGFGVIQSATVTGTAFEGDAFTVYPAMTISEAIEGGDLADGTTLSVGAIATIELEFPYNHGLVPGASVLVDITSNPPPAISTTDYTVPSSGDWRATAFGAGTFVAIRNSSNQSAISIDGQNWEGGGNLPSSAAWTSVAAGYIGEIMYFVAVASGGTAAAYSIDEGQTWSASTLPSSGTWTSVAYADGRFVAVRSASNAAAYSTNGTTWSAATLPSSTNWNDVAGGTIGTLTYFVAISNTSGTVNAYSINGGATWTAGGALTATDTWRAVAYGSGTFIAVSDNNVSYSTNGTTWTAGTLPAALTNVYDVVYGDDVFLVVGQDINIATSFDGLSWTADTVNTNITYRSVSYGNYSGLGTFIATGDASDLVAKIDLQSANHKLAAGPFIINAVPSSTTLRYAARTTGFVDDSVDTIQGQIYSRPDAFFTHRPFDGGVQLGTGNPSHAAQAVRQSKKYIRYQSGKGIMYTTGALFAPSYNLVSATANGIEPNSVITFTTDDTDHGLQAGGIIEITGMVTSEYNGIFTVESIRDARVFRVRSNLNLGTTTGVLGQDSKVTVKNWHGATVRTGPFDDQNGLYLAYDGQRMILGRRSSTFQLAGNVAVDIDSNLITGTNTRFQDQLKVGDRVVLRGMSHTVTSISSQTSMTFAPDFRGVSDISGAKLCLTQDLQIPQEYWNMDQADGSGPSGFELDPTKMQMVGIQYSWYAAGFIEWMMRGADGKFVFLHRLKNSNINTEAYMRTANLPVRYEVENSSARSYLRKALGSGDTSMVVADGYYFPTSGTVYVDNELISFTGRNGDTLTGLTRAANYSNFSAGVNRVYTAGSAASHSVGSGVTLVSCTITPQISHWGSALLTDGLFDEDRGYLFSYKSTGISVSTTKNTAFLIRLAPSVSNALIGDLGERELINRAQLLLQGLELTSETGTGGIVVEGILNPQNYPINPSDISWGGLSGLAQGGQPSFVQIAPGGSVNWNGGASLTTATAIVSNDIDTGFVYDGFQNGERTSPLPVTLSSYTSAGPVLTGSQIYSQNPSAYTGTSGRTFTVTNVITRATYVDIYYQDQFGGTASTSNQNTSTDYKFVIPTYTGLTNRLLFTQASWEASGATVGTSVSAADSNWPAGTAVSGVVQKRLGGVIFYEVNFNQTSVGAISASNTVSFEFGNPPYAQPGETIFSFIATPGERSTLDLSDLKELTNTTIGGRGTFPNGPDVLAINVYKVSGTAVDSNIILRWSEAQA